MAKLYSATSLDDIAKIYRQAAIIAESGEQRTLTKLKRAEYKRERITWLRAAEILEQTELRLLAPQE